MPKIYLAAVTASVAAILNACAVGPNYHRPNTPTAAGFAGGAQPIYSNAPTAAHFWTVFGDDTLDQLVGEALAANNELRIAVAHLRESRALLLQSRFDEAPTITGEGGWNHQRYAAAEAFGAGTALDQRYYHAGFDAYWELDLFGRVRREVQSSRAQVEQSEAMLRDAQVSVTAEVASTYFELRGVQGELDVGYRNVDNQRATLDLTQSLLNAGRGTEFDTARAQEQLRTTLAGIPPLQAEIARDIHRLSVLTGRQPQALSARLASARALPELPQLVAIGDPASLLRRRPDIRAAERSLAASSANIGVAVGDLFPKVSFNGNVGYAAGHIGALGSAGTGTFLIAPTISWAAFDLGRVRARIKGARAASDASLASYEQMVLRALEETENALVTHDLDRDQLVQLSAAARAARTAADIAHARYQGGLVGFLEVLDAERTQLTAEDALARGRTDTATSLVALYKALGGGWEGASLPVNGPALAAARAHGQPLGGAQR